MILNCRLIEYAQWIFDVGCAVIIPAAFTAHYEMNSLKLGMCLSICWYSVQVLHGRSEIKPNN